MPTKKQFQDFLNDIEPSATTKSESSSAHKNLRQFLKNHDDFKKVHINTFLSGSYKRNTAIRPRIINGNLNKPDIDIIVVTDYSIQDNPKDVIKFLRDCLKDGDYGFIDPPNTRSVGVYTDKVDMDVVPIIAPDGMNGTLYIPDKDLNEWLITNPPRHTSWTEEVNDNCDGKFKPLVKLVKWWRRENPTISRRPKGFVIECIVAENIDYNHDEYENIFLNTFQNIINKYGMDILAQQVPFIRDPGVLANSVTEGMTINEFSGFYNKVQNHLEIGRNTQRQDDPEKELKLWRKIFGDRFPAAQGSAANSLLGSPISSNAIRFPDKPVKPNKPAGFA